MSEIKFVIVYGDCKPVFRYTDGEPKMMRFDTKRDAEKFRQSLAEPELYEIIDEVEMVKRRHKDSLEMMKKEGD